MIVVGVRIRKLLEWPVRIRTVRICTFRPVACGDWGLLVWFDVGSKHEPVVAEAEPAALLES